MKGDIRLQMFHQKIDLLHLIVKRCGHSRYITAACLILMAQQLAPPSWAQPTRKEAVNLRDHIYKGNSLLQHRDYEGAIAEYEQAMQIDATNNTARDNIVLTHNNWGIDLFRQKKYEEAREQWEMALKLNPYDRNAKNNLGVLKTTLTRLGPAAEKPAAPSGDNEKDSGLPGEGETKSGPSIMPKGAQAPKADNSPVSNAVLLGKPSGGPSPSTDGGGANSSATTGGGSSGGVVILNSGARQSSSTSLPTPASHTPPVRDNPYESSTPAPSAQRDNPYADTPKAPPAPPPGSSTSSSSSSSFSSLGGANIDDKLSAIETKVYGHASKDTPLLQRLERLERDTSSRASLGSINDRVQTLLKTYGL